MKSPALSLIATFGIVLTGAALASLARAQDAPPPTPQPWPADPAPATDPATEPAPTTDLAPTSWQSSSEPLGSAPAKPVPAQGLTVEVRGVRNARGNVVVLVFSDGEAFDARDYDRLVEFREVPAASGDMTIDFAALRGDEFGVMLWHDEDSDRDLDESRGAPNEGYGASGRVGRWDDPKWRAARVPAGRTRITMHYL